MTRQRLVLFGVCLALQLSSWACVEAPRQALPPTVLRPLGWVDVRLAEAPSMRIGCEAQVAVLDRSGAQIRTLPKLGTGVELVLVRGRIQLGSLELGPPPLELRPVGEAFLSLSGTRYRGLFRLEAGEAMALRVVNRLPVEAYLRGVLPGEMPDMFGLEALKAQAVAARSYALSEIGQRGWLHPDHRSQVYRGVDSETWITSRAVEQTAGQVLTHNGKVISAWFHSTCGGSTRPAREIYPAAPSGVLDRSVVCGDCTASGSYSWTRSIAGERVCEAARLPVAPLELVEALPGRVPGRPLEVRVRAGGREAKVTSESFRSRLSSGQPRENQLLSTLWAERPRVEAGALVISGRGWGHGVGLCQYGAAGYAARGAGYRAILARYYVGAELMELK